MIDQKQFEQYNIPKEKLQLVGSDRVLKDARFDTKPVGYFKDALNRFRKNKASVVAFVIIVILVIYAIIGPLFMDSAYVNSYGSDKTIINYRFLTPKLSFMEGTGIWDGTQERTVSEAVYLIYRGMEIERGRDIITKVSDPIVETSMEGDEVVSYKIRVDTYNSLETKVLTLTTAQYQDLQNWQNENNIQVILPRVKAESSASIPDIWFASDKKGVAILDNEGNLVPDYYTTGKDDYDSIRIASDPFNETGDRTGAYRYAQRTGKAETGYNYVVRIDTYNYFIYKYGFEPSFVFGTNENGYDIFSRLASGARFSFLLAIFVSAINLFLGTIYGAIEGYYGGFTDMFMERISDILSGVPFMVVTVLFQLHLASKVGMVPSLFFAFILTGWIGMASRVRMQFYRFKHQEYVLAAKTLGARDFSVMFKHIFPNSLGTIITGSVLVIPGVIFSETSLSYLGIINLDSSTMSSVGSMLSAGQSCLTTAPHVVFFPALFIALLEISFNLFGNGLRDAFNPSLRGTED